MDTAKNLVIVESPSKAKTIGKFLGSKYKVIASVGHLRDLPKSRIGIDIENEFEPQYISIRGKGDIIKELKKEAKKANKVYLATTNNKNVYKQLKKCPYVSFLSHSKDYLSFISVNGNIHFTDDINLRTRVLNEYPAIKELFKTPDNPIFELFYINVEEIRTFDLKTYTNENFKIEKP